MSGHISCDLKQINRIVKDIIKPTVTRCLNTQDKGLHLLWVISLSRAVIGCHKSIEVYLMSTFILLILLDFTTWRGLWEWMNINKPICYSAQLKFWCMDLVFGYIKMLALMLSLCIVVYFFYPNAVYRISISYYTLCLEHVITECQLLSMPI